MTSHNWGEVLKDNVWNIGLSIIICYFIYKLVKRKRNLPPGITDVPLHSKSASKKIERHVDHDSYKRELAALFSPKRGSVLCIFLPNDLQNPMKWTKSNRPKHPLASPVLILRDFLSIQNSKLTRKSSCVNARGIPPAMQQVLPMLFYLC